MSIDDTDLARAYDLDAVASWMKTNDRRRVALQLPDEKLPDAARVARALSSRVGALDDVSREVFILADTTFGACCVDEVAAAHRDADGVVHYGRACCSPTSRIPARFVFDRSVIDVEACGRALVRHAAVLGEGAARARCLVALADQEYAHAAEAVARAAKSGLGTNGGVEIVVADVSRVEVDPRRDAAIEASTSEDGRERVGACRFERPAGVAADECAFVWIGGAGPSMTHAMLVLSDRAEKFGGLAQYDPSVDEDVRIEADGASEAARALKRRRFLIAKAKEARVVGIVAGTLGVAGYREMIENLRKMIANSGRKSYTVVAGKPNPQKLANFPEIEVFVMVSCELTALMDSRDYMQPIITPYEASIAFSSGKMWMGEVKLDFASVPPPALTADDASDEPEFSLISGELGSNAPRDDVSRTMHDSVDALTGVELARRAEDALTLRASGSAAVVVSSGAEYLISRRTYVGLEPGPKRDDDTGEITDAPLLAARGLSGRAREYSVERD